MREKDSFNIDEILERALSCHRAGNLQDAKNLYRKILQDEPDHVRTLHLLGALMQQMDDGAAAESCLRKAISLAPTVPGLFNDLCIALRMQGRFHEALVECEKAIALKPNFAEAHINMGNTFIDVGNYGLAEEQFLKSITINPTIAEAKNGLGLALRNQGRHQEAVSAYRAALSINANLPEAHNNLGVALKETGAIFEAISSYQSALAIRPEFPEAFNNLGNAYLELGEPGEAVDWYREGMLRSGNYDASLLSSYLMVAQYLPDYEVEELISDHEVYSRRFELPLMATWPDHAHRRKAIGSEQKLRVGFVSGDLREHPVGYFLENVLKCLKPKKLDIVLYSTVTTRDSLTDRLESMGYQWKTLVGMTYDDAAEMLVTEGIDILVDLAGHTARNALPLFARKPAPIQVSWLGYFATTGLKAIDYIIADPHSVLEDERNTFVEEVWRLPDTRLCFTPPTENVPVGPLPAQQNGKITFGCFNNLSKINSAVLALWSRVLNALPDSRVMLKSKELDNPDVQRATIQRFAASGIQEHRLILRGSSPRKEYLGSYNEVDICLDPFPFTGATTSMEGLWMGVPLVTRRGNRLLARQGESILKNLGMHDWIADNDDAYVECAVRHGNDLANLSQLRNELRQTLISSPLCDAPRFAGHLETAFFDMWKVFCSDQTR